MAAKDYIIVTGFMNAYIAKRKAPTKKGPQTMSMDRRVIEDREIIGLFEFYLRNRCAELEDDTIVFSRGGEKIFEAKLYDFSKEDRKEVQP